MSSLNTDGLDLSVSAGTGHAQAVVGDGCHDAAHVCAMSHGVAAVDGVRLEGFVVVGAPRGVGEQAGHQFLVGEAGTGIQNSDDDGALGLGGLPRVRNVRLRERTGRPEAGYWLRGRPRWQGGRPCHHPTLTSKHVGNAVLIPLYNPKALIVLSRPLKRCDIPVGLQKLAFF